MSEYTKVGTYKVTRTKVGRFTSFKSSFKKRFGQACMLAMFGGVLTLTYMAGTLKEPIVKEVLAEEKFADYPLLVKICKAESGNRQFLPNGDVVRGKVNHSDIGFCQINEPLHNDDARRLGYDIYTEQGNKDYAIYLFLHEGSTPWNSSRAMWSK